ncbi:hypothetical protein [Trebonia sp.]|uniref:hypothetical protein n=1 Tax=Trebonia sp. TaxID=2767075 RepID=UPI002637A4A1|nr:hypothetical protein [Trebonia sp.]
MTAAIIVAIIGVLGATIGAVVSALYARRLARVQSELDEERDVRKARRDYEYEARKRLYSAYEPIKFQLIDLIGQALRRISMLSLVAPETGSLPQAATVYEILAPAALVRMLDRNLTLADMYLEPQVSIEYGLMKAAYRVLADSSSIASIYTELSGDHIDIRDEELQPCQVDEAADALLGSTPNDLKTDATTDLPGSLLTFSQFRTVLADIDVRHDKPGLSSITALLDDFTPARRPVFWRALVTQVLLYGCYLDLVLRSPLVQSERLQNLAASLLPQLEHALDVGLRLDKFWMSDERPEYIEVNAQAVRDALPCAVRYYQIRVLSAMNLKTLPS